MRKRELILPVAAALVAMTLGGYSGWYYEWSMSGYWMMGSFCALFGIQFRLIHYRLVGWLGGRKAMSEDEWLTSTDPIAMLMAIQHLRLDPRLRRFAVECCRRVSHLIEGDVFQAAAAAGEAFADDPKNLRGTIPAMAEAMMRGCRARPGYAPKHERARFYANDAALATCGATDWSAAFNTARTAALAVAAGSDDVPSPDEQEWQAARLRSIVGNPFAPPRPTD